MSKKLSLTAAALSIVLSQPALAENNGWYVGGKLGASFIKASDHDHRVYGHGYDQTFKTNSKTKAGFNVGLQAGYNFAPQYNANVRLELDSTYRPEVKMYTPLKDPSQASFNETIAKVTMYTNMINAYFDIDTGSDFTPYLSAGLGVSTIDAKLGLTRNLMASKTETNFAWAVGAGVAYNINQNLDLDLSYRYLDAGKVKISGHLFSNFPDGEEVSAKFVTHDVTLGLRYSF